MDIPGVKDLGNEVFLGYASSSTNEISEFIVESCQCRICKEKRKRFVSGIGIISIENPFKVMREDHPFGCKHEFPCSGF